MSGGLPRLAGYAGRPFRASDFNTIAAREAYFATPARAATWWTDDALATLGYDFDGTTLEVPAGDLPNATFFAPFDWPRAGMPLRRPRVVRVLVAESNTILFYPGDPGLTAVSGTTPPAQDGIVADRIFNTFAPAIEAALAGTGILFALHQMVPIDAGSGFGDARFLRALAAPAAAGLVAADVLDLVFLFQSGSFVALDTYAPTYHAVYAPWNALFAGSSNYVETDGDDVYVGLTATFAADADLVRAGHGRFASRRTVLVDLDPGPQDVVDPGAGENDALVHILAATSLANVASLTDTAASLADCGFEYGGSFDPLTEDAAAFVALVVDHFGL